MLPLTCCPGKAASRHLSAVGRPGPEAVRTDLGPTPGSLAHVTLAMLLSLGASVTPTQAGFPPPPPTLPSGPCSHGHSSLGLGSANIWHYSNPVAVLGANITDCPGDRGCCPQPQVEHRRHQVRCALDAMTRCFASVALLPKACHLSLTVNPKTNPA